MIQKQIAFILLVANTLFAELPSNLPGEEITHEYLKYSIKKDSTLFKSAPLSVRDSSAWFESVQKTWDAPSLAEQMASDKVTVPLGKGGIFIPRFTIRGTEPDIEIVDAEGQVYASGEPGETQAVEPGIYFAILGSGTQRQKIVNKIKIEESKTVPLVPNWSGLVIETIDTNSTPFRGEYELVNITDFDPYGRGFGADPDRGDMVNTWILKPGTYKILGRGESFNTLVNFITVRLLPGELTKVLLIQNPENMKIISGGTVDITPGKAITSNWKYGANIGMTLQFNGETNRLEKHKNSISSFLSTRTNFWLRYNKTPYEWESSARLDEGFNLSDLDLSHLTTGPDELRIHSIFIWRFIPWFGPYCRAELRTNLLPHRISLDKSLYGQFCMVDDKNAISTFDSLNQVKKLSAPFSPLTLDFGGGANFDAFDTRFFELKIQIGVGSSFNRFPDRYISISSNDIDTNSINPQNSSLINNSIILRKEKKTRIFEFGPQSSLIGNVQLGRIGTAGAELKIFAPIVPEMRFKSPDFDFSATLSWRLARAVTLDYEYDWLLKQPENLDARLDKSTHNIWLRFSFSSR
ncbi:MAG TPA: hypothetical protein VHP36_03800 [Chitinispirillaceae bacterium]|nr:hypothetical protein [Chitinispirillaceae bacterium]